MILVYSEGMSTMHVTNTSGTAPMSKGLASKEMSEKSLILQRGEDELKVKVDRTPGPNTDARMKFNSRPVHSASDSVFPHEVVTISSPPTSSNDNHDTSSYRFVSTLTNSLSVSIR